MFSGAARGTVMGMNCWSCAGLAAIGAAAAACLATVFAAAPKKLSSYNAQAIELLAKMTLDEKIGQMTQADQSALKDSADVEHYFLGSVLSGGDSDPKEGNTLQAWTDLYDRIQQRAARTRLAIPLLYGVDAVHGHNNVLGAVIFPHNIALGCTRNAALVQRIARITAEEVRATGINWTFAPCVTVPQDLRWGRTYEGFSEDPSIVRDLGAAAVLGLQGDSLSNPLSILACAKHYVGDGGTAFGSARGGAGIDQGDTRIGEDELRRLHLPGYVSAIHAGAGSIMPSYSSWNGVKVSSDRHLLTDILKTELGFEGFLISDYNAIDQIRPGDYKGSIELSINAGMDMAMAPVKYRDFIANLKALVKEGKVPMARIDDAVIRILRVKLAMGLMDKSRSPLADRKLHRSFGSPEHREVAREAVRESLVLLKNERNVLPVSKTARRIHVAGKNADDIGNQCGGWTIRWQGRGGAVTTGGTTILAAIRNTVSRSTQVTYSIHGTGAAGADAGIVVAGETPYAEGAGDRASLALGPDDLDAIHNMKSAGIPVVVVLISGRPIVLGDVLDRVDAWVAAWLPGTEGQGVADVLFGDFKPTGKLSFSWPRSMADLPVRRNDSSYRPLFRVGYGLTYN
jgi:beta-glucosidase